MTLGHVYRSILSCGLLCQHYDFDVIDTGLMDGENVVLPAGKVTEGVHKLLVHLAKPSLPQQVVLYAYKGIGQMTVRKPELLVMDTSRDLIIRALQPKAAAQLKRQTLANLRLLLTADEERLKIRSTASGATAKEKKDQLEGIVKSGETSAAVTGSLQSHLPAVLQGMLDPRDASVRHAALALVGSLLSNGLAHPAKIIPKVLALEVDTEDFSDVLRGVGREAVVEEFPMSLSKSQRGKK